MRIRARVYLHKEVAFNCMQKLPSRLVPCILLLLLFHPSPPAGIGLLLAQRKLVFHWRRKYLLRWLKILQSLNIITLILEY